MAWRKAHAISATSYQFNHASVTSIALPSVNLTFPQGFGEMVLPDTWILRVDFITSTSRGPETNV